MKATEITMQIVKNLGNYETCRLEATFTLDESDELQKSFLTARNELEMSFNAMYHKEQKTTVKEKLTLSVTSKEFDRVCKSLHEGKVDLKYLQDYFDIDKSAMDYFKQYKLIK